MLKFSFDIFIHKDFLVDAYPISKIIYKKSNFINNQKITLKKKIIKINHTSALNISGGNISDNNSQALVPFNERRIIQNPTIDTYGSLPKNENSESGNCFDLNKYKSNQSTTISPLSFNSNGYEYVSYEYLGVVDEIDKKKDNPNNFTGDLSNHFVPHILFDINGCRRIAIIKLEDIYETETYFIGKHKIKKNNFLGTTAHWNYHDAFYPICYRGSFYPIGTYDYPPLIICKTRFLRWHFRPTEVYIKLRKDRLNDYYPKIRIYRRCPDYFLRSFNDDYTRYHYEFRPRSFFSFKAEELKEIRKHRGWRGFFYRIYLFILEIIEKLKSLIFNSRRTHFDYIRIYSNSIARRYPISPRKKTRYSSVTTNQSILDLFKIHRENRLNLNDMYKLKIGRYYGFGYKIKSTFHCKKNLNNKYDLKYNRLPYQFSKDNFIKRHLNNNLLNGVRFFHNKYINPSKYISNNLLYDTVQWALPNNRVNYLDNLSNIYYDLRLFNYYKETLKPKYYLKKSLKKGFNYYKTIERKNYQKIPIYKYGNDDHFLYKFDNKKVGKPQFAIYTKFPNEISKRDNNKILYPYPQINGKYYELTKNYPIRQIDQKGCLTYPCPFIDINGNLFYEQKYYNWTLFYPNYYPESLVINSLNPQQFWLKQHFWIKQYFEKDNRIINIDLNVPYLLKSKITKNEKISLIDNCLNFDKKSFNDSKKISKKYGLNIYFKQFKADLNSLKTSLNFLVKSESFYLFHTIARVKHLEKLINWDYARVIKNETLETTIQNLRENNILSEIAIRNNKKFIKKPRKRTKIFRYHKDYLKNFKKIFWKNYFENLIKRIEYYKNYEKDSLKYILEQKNRIKKNLKNDIKKLKNEDIGSLNIENFSKKNINNLQKSKFIKIQDYFSDSELLKTKNSFKNNKYEKNLITYKEQYKNYLIKYEKYLTNTN